MDITTIQKTTNIQNNFLPLIDFHSHILPGLDDGAKNEAESLEMLRKEIKQGVKTVVLTPHFYPASMKLDEFLQARREAYVKLENLITAEKLPIKLVLGCEVKFSPSLLELDLRKLCIENTDFLMVEFSQRNYHSWMNEVFFRLNSKGYNLIIAHVERYDYLPENDLFQLINAGAIAQANTSSLQKGNPSKNLLQSLMEKNMVHIWGTDTHDTQRRAPVFMEVIPQVEKLLGPAYMRECQQAAFDILNNQFPVLEEPVKGAKKLFSFKMKGRRK